MCKNIRQKQKVQKNKPKIIATMWNECELPDDSYSVSDIQEYIVHITKKHE